jgi:hypothetical protein
MSAVTGFHRLPILAIAVLLAAGCGANPVMPSNEATPSAFPSASPGSAPPATTAPVESASAPVESPIPPPSAEPTEPVCPSAPRGDRPDVRISDGDRDTFWKPLDITRMSPVGDPHSELEPPAGIHGSWTDFLLGGGETRIQLAYGSRGWPDTHTITRFRLVLETAGQEPAKLPVRFETGQDGSTDVFVDVPDIAWRGKYDLRVDWHDACFAYEAMVSAPLIIDPRVSVEGCPERRNPAFEELGATFDPPIGVGPLDANLSPWRFVGKVISLAVIDPLPPYVGFRSDSPTFTALPGANVDVTSWSGGLDLWLSDDVRVEWFRRGELIRWIEGGWIHGDEPEAEVVARSRLLDTDGGFAFTAPSEPGRYAATAVFNYNSACSFGVAGFVVGIDVVAP